MILLDKLRKLELLDRNVRLGVRLGLSDEGVQSPSASNGYCIWNGRYVNAASSDAPRKSGLGSITSPMYHDRSNLRVNHWHPIINVNQRSQCHHDGDRFDSPHDRSVAEISDKTATNKSYTDQRAMRGRWEPERTGSGRRGKQLSRVGFIYRNH